MELTAEVKEILAILSENGFSAYAVGGGVRDMLLGKQPVDWDIATSALPEQISGCFARTIPTGIRHGTVTALFGGGEYEITTYRVDGEYADMRHPDSVSFTDNISLDLSRRDFTINAMALGADGELLDPFGGRRDIEAGLIRCVGEPDVRFREDALRMLRAVRFHAQLGFGLEEKTLASIAENSARLKSVSAERIKSELDKILLSENSGAVRLLYETGLLEYIMPELCVCFKTEQHIKYHLYDVGTHSIRVTENVPPRLVVRYAALMHDLGKPAMKTTDSEGVNHFKGHAEVSVSLAREIMQRLKFDNASSDKILRLIKHHDREILIGKKYVKRAALSVGEDIFEDLMDLKSGDALGQNPEYTRGRLDGYEKIRELYKEINDNDEVFSLKKLAVNGNDMKALGMSGKQIGNALDRALLYVIDNPDCNEREKILEFIQKYFSKHFLF